MDHARATAAPVSHKDGAPRHPKTITAQHVTPTLSPYSRYGNPESYRVNGLTYNVMRKSKNYKERGIASWYGTLFHKKRTSSGDDYDMYSFTAAHKTLPLPSYVKVKNLENGREITVKVNDRGPFYTKRIIDLSYAAAKKLGILSKGTAAVEIEALASHEKEANYYIQAAAFSSEEMAIALKKKLSQFTSIGIQIEHHDDRYLVKLGPFSKKIMVDRLQATLKSHGIHDSFAMMSV